MFVNMFEYVIVCSVWLAACLSVSVYGGLECKCACVSGYGWTCTYKHTNTHTHAQMVVSLPGYFTCMSPASVHRICISNKRRRSRLTPDLLHKQHHYQMCVLILLYTCPHTTMRPGLLLDLLPHGQEPACGHAHGHVAPLLLHGKNTKK